MNQYKIRKRETTKRKIKRQYILKNLKNKTHWLKKKQFITLKIIAYYIYNQVEVNLIQRKINKNNEEITIK